MYFRILLFISKIRGYQLQVLQNKAAKVLLNLPPRSSSTEALDCLDLKTLLKRRHFHRCVMMNKYLSGGIDFNFDIRRNSSFHSYQTRGSNDLQLPRVRTKLSFIKPLRTGTT